MDGYLGKGGFLCNDLMACHLGSMHSDLRLIFIMPFYLLVDEVI